jgi:hypothetical protein
MHLPQEQSLQNELKFNQNDVIMSVNVRNVLVKPIAVAKEGYGDCFEVLLAGAGSKKMSLLGSLSGNSKEITTLVFLVEDSYQMKSWMRAISNPFADLSRDPPDASPSSTSATNGNGVSSNSSTTDTSSTDVSLDSSGVVPVMENAMRDLKRKPSSNINKSTIPNENSASVTDAEVKMDRSSRSNSPQPHRVSVLVTTEATYQETTAVSSGGNNNSSSSAGGGGGGDEISGSNPMRKKKNVGTPK